jgi:hypothetical protein
VILCGLQLLAAQAIERDNPVVQGLAWVRQQYVQGMVLGGVTSAEINGEYVYSLSKNFFYSCFAAMVTKRWVLTCTV